MADDNDLIIRLIAKADLSDFQALRAEFPKLGAEIDALQAKWNAGSGGGFLGPIPSELMDAGPLGPGGIQSTRAKELLGAAQEAAGATSRVAREASLAGTNFLSAATHAAILTRGLANGHLELRAMTVLAHTLGTEYLAAGGAVGAIGAAMLLAVKAAQEELKYQQDLGKEYDNLIQKAHEFASAAKGALSAEDVTRVIQSALPEVEKLDAKLKEMHEKDLSNWKKIVDFISQGANFGKGYESQNKQRIEDQEKLKEKAEDVAYASLKQAEAHKAAVDALKAEDSTTALANVSKQIEDITAKQQALNIKTLEGQKAYVEYAKQLETLEKIFKDLQSIEDKRTKTADEAYGNADESVKRVLMNEKAATDARAAGQERDADMYKKSAEQYAAGLNPAQQAQLANLRKLQELAYGGPPKPPEIIWGQGETGTGGPSLIGPAAERVRMQGVEQTRKESAMSDSQKLDELIRLSREQVGLWR